MSFNIFIQMSKIQIFFDYILWTSINGNQYSYMTLGIARLLC